MKLEAVDAMKEKMWCWGLLQLGQMDFRLAAVCRVTGVIAVEFLTAKVRFDFLGHVRMRTLALG